MLTPFDGPSNRVPETMPLYDILNEFQKGHSHMAAVIKPHNHVVEQQESKHLARGEYDFPYITIFLCQGTKFRPKCLCFLGNKCLVKSKIPCSH